MTHFLRFSLIFLPFLLIVVVEGQNLNSTRQLALQGDVKSMMALGIGLYRGEGVGKNYQEAFIWLHKAAEKGHPDAMYSVALMYFRGIGTRQSMRDAATWVTKAANLGHAYAQNVLATLYQSGNGVIKSFPEAFKWRQNSALAGLPEAQMALANHYKSGDIVGQDIVQAYAWFNIADVSGTPSARVNREILGVKMTPQQLTQAQTFSAEMSKRISQTPPALPAIQGGKVTVLPGQKPLTVQPTPAVGQPPLPNYVPPTSVASNPGSTFVSGTPVQGGNFTIPGLELEMIWVSPGKFLMGSPASEPERNDDETQHEVTLTKGYWLGKYEVTQKQYGMVMGKNPSQFREENHPVSHVNWNDAEAFCQKLGNSTHAKGRVPLGYQYGLPTEAQWEFACRATSTGSHAGNLADMAWFLLNSGRKAHPVGQKLPNTWGFHDMHGNLWEWCLDYYGHYLSGTVKDPSDPSSGSFRVVRGGSKDNGAGSNRSSVRRREDQGNRVHWVSFRLCLSPATK